MLLPTFPPVHTLRLPVRAVIELYVDHCQLFSHVQEFYADLTSLYHSSPKARLATLMMRLDELGDYMRSEAHTRASHAIGAILLAEWLEHPEDWPSIHFPPKVPADDVEVQTLVYIYEHIDPNWTLNEDRALRDLVGKFIRTRGQSVLTRKGTVPLGNRLEMRIMAADDREAQSQRDAWVKEQLQKVIDSGRADPPAKEDEKSKKGRYEDELRIRMPWVD